LKFFTKTKKSNQQHKQTVLFICIENAGRSQIAEGFFRIYSPHGYHSVSAGTKPASSVNPLVIQVMKEVGIDIGIQRPKILTEDMMKQSSIRVNMGCVEKESCPTLVIHNVLDWNIEDPKDKPIEKAREIRDIIEERVRELVSNLNQTNKQINI
jgi:arsenate reductase (thioredoxin)